MARKAEIGILVNKAGIFVGVISGGERFYTAIHGDDTPTSHKLYFGTIRDAGMAVGRKMNDWGAKEYIIHNGTLLESYQKREYDVPVDNTRLEKFTKGIEEVLDKKG